MHCCERVELGYEPDVFLDVLQLVVKPAANKFGNRNSRELRVYNHSVGIVLSMRTVLASIISDRKDWRIELNEDVLFPERVRTHVNDGVSLREPRQQTLDFILLHVDILCIVRVLRQLLPVAMEPLAAKSDVEQVFG